MVGDFKFLDSDSDEESEQVEVDDKLDQEEEKKSEIKVFTSTNQVKKESQRILEK